jgi:hypothetical protein
LIALDINFPVRLMTPQEEEEQEEQEEKPQSKR